MGNTWEIELLADGRGWVGVSVFEGTPAEAIQRLVSVRNNHSANCYRLVWRP